eukprot:TRINITY_DN3310_c0_g2_i2.p1 TRINITY_DN3310_c0_g2~~TRINITY_DN3310_c0_g2_i2.p1  ORF type:complete len:419 (+),score=78.35 TRINITY_DN3310_c0_g2_i2:37-1257(+)
MSHETQPLVNIDPSDVLLDEKEKTNPNEVYPSAMVFTMTMFAGYASLFALQGKLLDFIHKGDPLYVHGDSDVLFGVGTSFLYLGNLIFRLGHNVFFFFLTPRERIFLSMWAMFFAEVVLVYGFITLEKGAYWMVFLAYGLGGLGIGCFESNMINICTPLGPKTKKWAVSGIPPGVSLLTVGSFVAMVAFPSLDEHVEYIYASIGVLILFGMFCVKFRMPNREVKGQGISLTDMRNYLDEIKDWIGPVLPYAVAMMFNMFCVSFFSPGIVLYIFGDRPVLLDYGVFSFTLSHNAFVAIYNILFFLGDFCSRRVFFDLGRHSPFIHLIISAFGIICGLSQFGAITLFCAFAVAWANGTIYCQSTREIDEKVHSKYNLIATSMFFFIGDCGSVVGSNLIQIVKRNFFSG